MAAENHLPDYEMCEADGDIFRFTRRDAVVEPGRGPILEPETLDFARTLSPGADVYALEAEWQSVWARNGRTRLQNPDKAFLGWVKKQGARTV